MHTVRRIETPIALPNFRNKFRENNKASSDLSYGCKFLFELVHTFISLDRILRAMARPLRHKLSNVFSPHMFVIPCTGEVEKWSGSTLLFVHATQIALCMYKTGMILAICKICFHKEVN